MSIRRIENKDGSVSWRVREYTGFTLDGVRDRTQKTFSKESDAKRYQAQVIAKRDALSNRSGRITLESYVYNWYYQSIDHLARSTQERYKSVIKANILPVLGRLGIQDINRPQIQRMLDTCSTEYAAKMALKRLKAILNQAIVDNLIMINPAMGHYRLPKPKESPDPVILQTFEDMKPILHAIDLYLMERIGTYRENIAVCVAKVAYTGFLLGLRPEERYGLSWENFDFDAKTVTITNAYVEVTKAYGGNDLKETKTRSGNRTLPFPPVFERRLMELLNRTNVIPSEQSGAFIVGLDGKRIDPGIARKRWGFFLEWSEKRNLDLPHVTVENMRHSFGTAYLAAGGKIEILQKWLGHTSATTTYRYVRPSQETLMDIGDTMSGIL